MNFSIKNFVIAWVVAAGALVTERSEAQSLVDLENAIWIHPSGSSTGWDASQLSGYTTLSDGNVVTLSVSFSGSATPAAGNLSIISESYFTGFAFQMDPATNTNPGSTFSNFERIDLTFSRSVLFNDFRITDVDRDGWDDALFVEGWNGAGGVGILGTGTRANYGFNATSNLGIETNFGLEHVIVASGGNTVNGSESDLFLDFGATPIDAVSIYYWNGDYASSETTQTIGLIATTGEMGFYVTPVPEPSGAILIVIGCGAVAMRRRRPSAKIL